MATLISATEKMRSVSFQEWKSGRLLRDVDAVLCSDGTVVLRSKTGGLFCNKLKNFAYLPGNWRFNDSVFKSLVKLGAISKEEAAAHLDECKRRGERKEAAYAAGSILRASEELGFKLTPRQVAELEKIKEEGPRL